MRSRGGGGKVFNERSRPLRYVPSTMPRSSSLRGNILIFWTTPTKVKLIAQILPSILPIFIERLDCSSSSPVIVEVFAETLKPVDEGWGSEKDDRRGLDLILALRALK